MTECNHVLYRGQTKDVTDTVGDMHPLMVGLEDAQFDIGLKHKDDVTYLRHSGRPGLLTEFRRGSDRLRLLDVEAERFLEAPEALSSRGDWSELFTIESVGKGVTEVGADQCEKVEYAVDLWNVQLQVTVASDAQVSDAVAESAAAALVPLELPTDGLPIEISVHGEDAVEPLVELTLTDIEHVDLERYETNTWEVATPDEILNGLQERCDMPERPDEGSLFRPTAPETAASDDEFGAEDESVALSTRSAALRPSFQPDAAWLVENSYFDQLQSIVNTALGSFSSANLDLTGGKLDWWSKLKSGIDKSSSQVEAFQKLLVVLTTTAGFQRDDQPDWAETLWSEVPVKKHLNNVEESAFKNNVSRIENEHKVSNPNFTPLLTTLPHPLGGIWGAMTSNSAPPPEVERWFALADAVNGNASDFDKRLGEIADSVWSDAMSTMGSTVKQNNKKVKMPGAPVDVSQPRNDRTFKKTVSADDVSSNVNLPGWISDLAEARVTAKRAKISVPKKKLTNLGVATHKPKNQPPVPIIKATLEIDSLSVDFTYDTHPVASVANAIIWVAGGGSLAALVTAAGNGTLTMKNIVLPLRLTPTMDGGSAAYEVTSGDTTVGTVNARIANYVPTSLVTSIVADVWLSNAEGFAENLLNQILEEALTDKDDQQMTVSLPFEWPASWRLRGPPDAEPVTAEDLALLTNHDTYARARDLAVDSGSYIDVSRTDNGGTVPYDLSSGPASSVDPSNMPQFDKADPDGGVVFSRRYLEAWLLQRLGVLSEYASLDSFVNDRLDVTLPPVATQVPASERDPEEFEDFGDDQRIPGVQNCQPPGGPRVSRSRESQLRRFTPTVELPPDGKHEHALEVQMGYDLRIQDVKTKFRWVPEIRRERCFAVGAPEGGPGVGPVIDQRIRGVIQDLEDIVGGRPAEPGERGGGDIDERSAAEQREEKEKLEKIRQAQEGTTQPLRTMSLRLSEGELGGRGGFPGGGSGGGMPRGGPSGGGMPRGGPSGGGVPRGGPEEGDDIPKRGPDGDGIPDRGPDGGREVICEPAHCEWRPASDRSILETYLSASATVRAKVRVGFSIFGPYEDSIDTGVVMFAAEPQFMNRVQGRGDGGGIGAMAGWLPQLNLSFPGNDAEDLNATSPADVTIHSTDGPIDNVAKDELRKKILAHVREDMFTQWLEPLSTTQQLGVGQNGNLVSNSLATLVWALLGEDPLADGNTKQVQQLAHLLRLESFGTQSDSQTTPPKHYVKGDYVYLPMTLVENLTQLFK